ncbi:MAG: DUF433 domain-containing protein [bacterium]|nr:DUF433 domain-containing protein [bacterium]
MKAISHKKELGSGIYTIPDISRLLRINRRKVNRYISEYWDERLGRKLFSDTYSWSTDKRNKAVNFYVLIELFTFFQLQEKGVNTKTILKARSSISKELGVEYPFASSQLLTDGKRIWYEFKDDLVSADGSSQTNFVRIIKSFAEKIEFREDDLAKRFWPAGKENSIIVDPHHQFGQPIIRGTNVNAEALFSMYRSGEPIEAIGILYDLSQKEVNDAIEFYRVAA